MSLNIFWFLPTHGDGKYLGTAEGARAVDHGYLAQIAQAADRLGYGGVLIPTGRSCEDSWLVAASLIPVTQNLKFLVALRPGIISPTVAARQAATLDRLSNGRALFNLVTGGDPDELAGDGLHLSHAEMCIRDSLSRDGGPAHLAQPGTAAGGAPVLPRGRRRP